MQYLLSLQLVLLLFFAAVSGTPLSGRVSRDANLPPNHYWFSQNVDHFDSLNKNTWKQLFWVNDTFYKPGGPVFFFLGGEAPIHFFDFQEVSALDWAAQSNAVYVALEHRFYGQSNPLPDLSVSSLRFLSSQQALADAAIFVDAMRSADPKYSGQWLVLGCSYSGALSAWFRTKYPHLVVGSVAPSAPVWAVWDFYQFFDNFAQQAPASCVTATKAATDKMNALLQTSAGRHQLAVAFNACEPIESEIDIFNFKYTIVTFLATTAQWENPGNAPPNGFQMTQACSILTSSNDFVTNWGRAFIQLQAPSSGQCTSFKFSAFLDPIRKTSLGNIDRSWWWQSCTEFGYFATTHGPKSTIFFSDMTIDIINSWCSKMFDVDGLTPNTNWTNTYYGGLREGGSNILFTNGMRDPWHTLSINQSPYPERNVLAVTYDAAHCAPMDAPDPRDPPSLTQARQAVANWIQQLLRSRK